MRGKLLTSSLMLMLFVCPALGTALPGPGEPPVGGQYPPEWRGQDGTTWALWEFSNDDPNPPFDQGSNRYGATTLTVVPAPGHVWQDSYDGQQGVWELSGTVTIEIDNRPEPLPEKWILVELIWQSNGGGLGVREQDSGIQGTLVLDEPINDTWRRSVYEIILPLNPPHETILITGIRVDRLSIDTICIPEPATLCLLAVGASLALLRRRR